MSSTHVYFHGDRLIIDMHNLSGGLKGHSSRRKLFGDYENYDFGCSIKQGGLSLKIELGLTTKRINGRYMASFVVEYTHIDVVSSKLNIENNS